MKNKVTALLFSALLPLFMLAGCDGNKRDSEFYPYNLAKYVELGEYLKADYSEKVAFVTQGEVDEKIKSDLKIYGLTTQNAKDSEAKLGDVVNIDYAGYLNDVAFEGGTAKGSDLELGSGSFIDGFEEGLVGKKAGDKVDLELTFPENYHSKEMAGKTVIFKVTVNAVYETVYPELTDELVSKISSVKNVKEYRENIYDKLEKAEIQEVEQENYNNLINAVVKCCKIKKYPKKEVEEYKEKLTTYYEQAAKSDGITLETLVSYNGYTMEKFNELMEENAKSLVAKEMVFTLIAEQEGILISTREYAKGIETYMKQNGYSSRESFLEDIGEDKLRGLLTVDKTINHMQTVLTDR